MQKIFLFLGVLGHLQNSVHDLAIRFLPLDGVEILFENHFLALAVFPVQIDISEFCSFSEEVIHSSDHVCLLEVEAEGWQEERGYEQCFYHGMIYYYSSVNLMSIYILP